MHNDPVEMIEHNGKTVEIHYDEDAQSPRENDNLGTIIYTSTRYDLGDKRMDQDAMKALSKRKDIIILPVYAYIHSGTVLNTTGFSCPWDSGQCGFIYVEKKKVREEWKVKSISAKLRAKILDNLRAEVDEFSSFLGGETYGYIIKDKNENEISSCWGYIGIEWVRQAAKEAC